MKYLGKIKVAVGVLLMLSVCSVIYFEMKYHTLLGILAWMFQVWEAPYIYVIEVIALVQCVNLSLALYILCILDKHLVPLY